MVEEIFEPHPGRILVPLKPFFFKIFDKQNHPFYMGIPLPEFELWSSACIVMDELTQVYSTYIAYSGL